MKIPNKLKIGGHVFDIKMVDMKSKNMLGECDSTENTISIDKDAKQSQKESTLIHEVFHAINTTIGDSTFGHIVLDSWAEQFYQVLKDNNLLRK